MGLRGRLRRLERDAEKEMIVIEQKGGQPKRIARAPSRYQPTPPEAGGVAQEATEQAQERRSWWSRMFGS